MPPLRAGIAPEYLPQDETSPYEQRREKALQVFDRMLGLLVDQEGDGFIADVILRSEDAFYQVEGQEDDNFTRAWLESRPQFETYIHLRVEEGYLDPGTKEFSPGDSTPFEHFSIAQDSGDFRHSWYGELTVEQEIKLLQDGSDTLDLIEQVTPAEKKNS